MLSRGRDKFKIFKPLFNFIFLFIKIFPFSFRKLLFIWCRNIPGKIGLGLRYIFLKSIAKKCGDNIAIFPHVWLLNAEKLTIGDNVSIQPLSYIECIGGITIGSDVSIAHGVTLMSSHHNYTNLKVPIRDQGISYRPISINSNVWIGAKATILGNIVIESGSIVGANSLVSHNIASNCIVGGIPAKIIKKREF